MTKFEEMMKSYADSHKQNTAITAKVYDEKNYFSTNIPKSESEADKTIRILPQDGNFWTVFHGHKKQLPDGTWKTFPCLKHEEGKDCPFCEAREALLATGKESDKKLAKEYSVRKMYILKVIERGNEKDGVKFWRFNHAYDKAGTLDKIMGAIKIAKHDVTDPETGRDLVVNIRRNQFNVPVVLSVNNSLEVSKLSEDANQAAIWLSDTRTWRDVYAIKNYNYLEIVVRGHTPVWSKEQEKFVAKEKLESLGTSKDVINEEDDDSELTMGETEVNNITIPVVDNTQPQEEEDDDLPF
jgi:hypothetical protein